MVALRWIFTPVVAVFVVLFAISGYRAIVQVYGVDLDVPREPLSTGSIVSTRVASSGRVHVTLLLEIVQGTRAETLGVKLVPSNRTASLDPRTRRGAISVVLTPAHLARLEAGPAVVRAVGLGLMQWLRTPPPVVREQAVILAPVRERSEHPDASASELPRRERKRATDIEPVTPASSLPESPQRRAASPRQPR